MRKLKEFVPDHSKGSKSLEEIFKKGTSCFILTPDLYGEQAEVMTFGLFYLIIIPLD